MKRQNKENRCTVVGSKIEVADAKEEKLTLENYLRLRTLISKSSENYFFTAL